MLVSSGTRAGWAALTASGALPLVAPPNLACLVLAIAYGVRLGALRRRAHQAD